MLKAIPETKKKVGISS